MTRLANAIPKRLDHSLSSLITGTAVYIQPFFSYSPDFTWVERGTEINRVVMTPKRAELDAGTALASINDPIRLHTHISSHQLCRVLLVVLLRVRYLFGPSSGIATPALHTPPLQL